MNSKTLWKFAAWGGIALIVYLFLAIRGVEVPFAKELAPYFAWINRLRRRMVNSNPNETTIGLP